MIFCGAPAHLTGVDGNVNSAVPPSNVDSARQVASTMS
jgi:hypothetical protein